VSSVLNRSEAIPELSEPELNALIGAATWYAKYHAGIIAELADDPSAVAVARRARFQDLYRSLSKLGVRLHRPPGIPPPT